jgi:alkylation response protein AidB-like acyl-CoA dehydrogenase
MSMSQSYGVLVAGSPGPAVTRPFTLTAAQAKLITGRLAVRATEEAVQIHGGYGFIEEYPVCRFYRDAKILTIGEGTDEIQQMVIARALGA